MIWKDGVKCSGLCTKYRQEMSNMEIQDGKQGLRLQQVIRDKCHAVLRNTDIAMRYEIKVLGVESLSIIC